MENMEKRESKLKSMLSRVKRSKEITFLLPWDQNQDIQSEFSVMMWDTRFIEGRQIRQLINIISEDCTNQRKIKPIDIEVFVEKFCEHLISNYHLVTKPSPPPQSTTSTPTPINSSSSNSSSSLSSSSSSSSSTPNDFISNHNYNATKNGLTKSQSQLNIQLPPPPPLTYEELLTNYQTQYTQTFEALSQLFKRSFYSEIYPLLKIILANEVDNNAIKFDLDLQRKVEQYKGQTLKELNMLPSNFPDDYDWTFLYANGKNPFETSISILNDLAFLTAPIDLVHCIQQSVSSIYTTCNEILNNITFGTNYQKVLENSSLLKCTRGGGGGGNGSNRDLLEKSDSNNNSSSSLSYSSSENNLSNQINNNNNINNDNNNNNNDTNINDGGGHHDTILIGIQSHPQLIQQVQQAQKEQVKKEINRTMPSHSLSADDLFPVFIYVVMNSDIIGHSGLLSAIIEHFSTEMETSGEFGWCSVSFQAAISHLKNL